MSILSNDFIPSFPFILIDAVTLNRLSCSQLRDYIFSAFYASCIAANVVEQLWNFAWPSAIALIHPSLLPVAVMGFFTKVTIIVGGPLVGRVMDHFPRMYAYNCLTVVQASFLMTYIK